MSKVSLLNLSHAQEIIVRNGVILKVYKKRMALPEDICKQNDFIKCGGCKEYFDEIHAVGIYHPKFDEKNIKEYCQKCFDKKY